jgi:hypothetical protein
LSRRAKRGVKIGLIYLDWTQARHLSASHRLFFVTLCRERAARFKLSACMHQVLAHCSHHRARARTHLIYLTHTAEVCLAPFSTWRSACQLRERAARLCLVSRLRRYRLRNAESETGRPNGLRVGLHGSLGYGRHRCTPTGRPSVGMTDVPNRACLYAGLHAALLVQELPVRTSPRPLQRPRRHP